MKDQRLPVLVYDSDPAALKATETALKRAGFDVVAYSTLKGIRDGVYTGQPFSQIVLNGAPSSVLFALKLYFSREITPIFFSARPKSTFEHILDFGLGLVRKGDHGTERLVAALSR